MTFSIRKFINTIGLGTAQNADFRVELSSDASGRYVEVVALDAGGSIDIGKVDQGTGGVSAWLVQQPDNRAVDQSLNSASLNAAITVTLNGGEGEVGFTLTGLTASGATITFEGTNSVGAASPLWSGVNALTGSILSSTATADGNYRVATGGRTAVRVRVSSTGTGTIKVSYSGSSASSLVALATSVPAGSNAIGGIYAAPTASSSLAITPGASSTVEGSHVLKASAGTLYSVYVTTGGTAGYLMTFNATSAPADGPVTPIECIAVPANTTGSISYEGSPPSYYSTGIVVVFSSTGPFTKTASATAFFSWRVQ